MFKIILNNSITIITNITIIINTLKIRNTNNKIKRSFQNMENETNIKKINLKLPETTHKKIKLIANIKGVTLNEYILSIINQELNQVDFNQLIENEL